MTGICGWIGTATQADESPAMAARLLGVPEKDHSGKPEGICYRPHARGVLAGTHPRGIVDAASDDDVHAVIEGSFRFTDPALARTAASVGPAGALIEGLRVRGVDVLSSLNGAFSLAIWNATTRELVLATDRFGTRPVVYATLDDGIVFGPSATCLSRHATVGATLDPQALFDFLYFSAVASPYTIYREMHRLEPAQYLIWRDGRTTLARYWVPRFEATDAGPASLRNELHDVLAEAVARADPDRRAGAFLSGGLDSSTVAGLLAHHQGKGAKTFSIGFDAVGYDEISYARIAARHFGNASHEYYVTPRDVAETIDRIAHAYDEPFGNSSAVPTYHCARLARTHGVSLMLAGDGGDEIFAGNERYVTQKVFESWLRIPQWLRSRVAEPIAFRLPGSGRIPPLRKLRRYIEQARVPLPDRLQTYNFLHITPLSMIFTPEFLRQVDPARPLSLLRDEYRRVDSNALDRMLYLDWKFTLADNDLRKVTVMCEQAGVEVRYPMLDNGVVEFSARVPARIKLPGIRLRHFYRQAMRGFLPDAILTKHKHGFGLPFGVWLAAYPDLRAIADECFGEIRKREIFLPAYLDSVIHRHRTEHAGFYGTMVWLIIILERWLAAHRP